MAKKEKRKSPLRGPVRQKSNNMTLRYDDLVSFDPMTANQEKACEAWDEGDNLVLTGTAGTGKTFLAMSLGLEAVLDEDTLQDKMVIIRSIVATRDPGHLPGTKQEKEEEVAEDTESSETDESPDTDEKPAEDEATEDSSEEAKDDAGDEG